jgi:hypothetical protein
VFLCLPAKTSRSSAVGNLLVEIGERELEMGGPFGSRVAGAGGDGMGGNRMWLDLEGREKGKICHSRQADGDIHTSWLRKLISPLPIPNYLLPSRFPQLMVERHGLTLNQPLPAPHISPLGTAKGRAEFVLLTLVAGLYPKALFGRIHLPMM